MKIGFVGAGKAGCSLGKYFQISGEEAHLQITGYYSLVEEEARWAADFTGSVCYNNVDDVVKESDTIILSTPDGAIKDVWNFLDKHHIEGKIICHLSGSLSSDVFSGIEQLGAYPISIHPMFAFSNKDSVYKQLNEVCFTVEGHSIATSVWKEILSALGNPVIEIDKQVKPMYHAAASLLSNHVIAVLHSGYALLEECGFSKEQARQFTQVLVKNNVSNAVKYGTVASLTGPVERGDLQTIKKHLEVISPPIDRVYRTCAKQLVHIASVKNPDIDYEPIQQILNEMNEK